MILQIETPDYGIIKIIDPAGRLIFEKQCNSNGFSNGNSNIRWTQELPTGIYQVLWTDGMQVARAQLVRL